MSDWRQRFWDKVDIKSTDECWPWKAGKAGYGNGYGYFWLDGRMQKANRLVFLIWNGFLPKNALHRCSNPSCCNPHHIFDGTQSENLLQAKEEGTLHNPYIGYAWRKT